MGGLAKTDFFLLAPQIISQGTRTSGKAWSAVRDNEKLARQLAESNVGKMQVEIGKAEERALGAEARAVAAEERAVAAEERAVEAQEALQRERGMQRQVVEEAVALALAERLPR